MAMAGHAAHGPGSLADRMRAETGVDVAHCYQCGKCSAGCPMAPEMDYPSSVLMRLLQTGRKDLEEVALRSHSIWLCLSCETCFCRCPMEIDIPHVTDFLRGESMRRKLVHPRAKNILRFHRAFLDSVRYTGRLYEVGLIADYKARSWKLWQDVVNAPILFFKGKLKLWPHRIQNRKALRTIFKRTGAGKESPS